MEQKVIDAHKYIMMTFRPPGLGHVQLEKVELEFGLHREFVGLYTYSFDYFVEPSNPGRPIKHASLGSFR